MTSLLLLESLVIQDSICWVILNVLHSTERGGSPAVQSVHYADRALLWWLVNFKTCLALRYNRLFELVDTVVLWDFANVLVVDPLIFLLIFVIARCAFLSCFFAARATSVYFFVIHWLWKNVRLFEWLLKRKTCGLSKPIRLLVRISICTCLIFLLFATTKITDTLVLHDLTQQRLVLWLVSQWICRCLLSRKHLRVLPLLLFYEDLGLADKVRCLISSSCSWGPINRLLILLQRAHLVEVVKLADPLQNVFAALDDHYCEAEEELWSLDDPEHPCFELMSNCQRILEVPDELIFAM